MPDPSSDGPTAADISRAALAALDPAQLETFDLVVEAFTRSPAVVRRAGRAGDEAMANAGVLAGEALSAMVLAVSTQMATGLARGGHPIMPPRWRRWTGRTARPEAPVPPVAEADVPELTRVATELAAQHGADRPLAQSMATALVRPWPRR